MTTITPGSGDDDRFAVRRAAEAVVAERDAGRAARVVAGRSTGVEDCAQLLEMLGLRSG